MATPRYRVVGTDGIEYFMPWRNLATFGPAWEDIRVLDECTFTPIAGESSGRWKDRPRAVDVRVTCVAREDIEMEDV